MKIILKTINYTRLWPIFFFHQKFGPIYKRRKAVGFKQKQGRKTRYCFEHAFIRDRKIIIWLELFMPNKMNEAKNYLAKLKKAN